MTMGPEPMMSIRLMSVLRGTILSPIRIHMILDTSSGHIEEDESLKRPVSEVDMRKLDTAEPFIGHNRRDFSLNPETQIIAHRTVVSTGMLSHASALLREKRPQAGKYNTETMALRGHLYLPGAKVFNRMVAAMMPVPQSLYPGTGSQCEDLMAQAHAKDRQPAKQRARCLDSRGYRPGVPRP